MIECNNVIPKIISVTDLEDVDVIISEFAVQQAIDPAFRIIIKPEKDELTVEQIHLMQKDIQVAFSKPVLVALQGVDNSSSEVQNSLLKCLEEDNERIQFLLLVTTPSRLLSTIRSRCGSIDTVFISSGAKQVAIYSEIFSFQKNSDATKEVAITRIDQYIQSPLLKKSRDLKYILNIRKLIIDNNMNPVLALDAILIFLSKPSTIKITHEK